jgi:hypothetical protein
MGLILFAGEPQPLLRSVGMVIVCLNDTHQWSREQIADWVELQEGLAEEKEDTTVEAMLFVPHPDQTKAGG